MAFRRGAPTVPDLFLSPYESNLTPLPSSLPPSLPSPRESRLFAWEINVRLPRIRGRYHQRNGVTFDKIGYYYPFLLSPQGVARPALARCFVSSSFNCSSRDRQVFELGRGRGKKENPLDVRLLFFR